MFGFGIACSHPLTASFTIFVAAAMTDQSKFGFGSFALESHYNKLKSARG